MNEKNETVSFETRAGNFGECLVEGNAEDKKRGRKTKRRAIAISIALQSAGLAALVIAPMLAKPAELKPRSDVMPIPPYSRVRPVRTDTNIVAQPPRPVCVICPQFGVRPITPSLGRTEPQQTGGGPIIEGASPEPAGGGSGLDIFDPRRQPKRPDEPPHEVRRIHEPSISPALLVNRVEPVFPALARQIRKNGKVELHAVIATDGTIQSLQVVSGDPLFVQSALDAVKQWRYQPTKLNGQPVEVDTFITVIYTVNQQ
jgi:periplasmic protein TonB